MLDLWRGGLTWRRLAVLVKHLPRDAALWGSLRAEAAVEMAGDIGEGPVLVLEDALEAMQYGPLEKLVHRFFNYFELSLTAKMSDEDRQRFKLTPPPGFKWSDDVSPDMFDLNSEAGQAYLQSMQSPS